MTPKKRMARSAAFAAIFGLALVGGAVPAMAQIESGLDLSTIEQLVQDDAMTGLHIHKHEAPAGEAGNGLPQDVTSPALANAQFTIERVEGIDLTTQAGWEAAQQLQEGTYDGTTTLTEVGVYTTNAEGLAVDGAGNVPSLPVGLYKVTETQSPSGYTSAAEPFYVALPMTDPVNLNTRLTDVHVYPKNAPTDQPTAVKTVADANTGAGINGEGIDIDQNVLYDITVTVPHNDVPYDQLSIDDYYESARLAPVGSGVTGVTGTAADGTAVNFDAGDYTITPTDPWSPTWSRITIEFTEAGLAKINEQKINEIVASFEFDALALEGDPSAPVDPARNTYNIRSSHENEQDKEPDEPGDEDTPPGDNPKTETYYGNVLLTKFGPADNSLAGAEFDLYRCNSVTDMEADPIRTGITTGSEDDPATTTVDETGAVWIKGLHVNDYVDDVAQPSDPTGYCLIETKSPEGYELQADPVYFTVNKDTEASQVSFKGVDVTDVESNAGFNLPLTGGAGVWYLLGAGGLLILVGGIYAASQRRKQA